jgi:fructokinase
MLGAVEGGGTKFKLLLGTDPTEVLDEETFPTTTPEETLQRVVEFFRRPRPNVELAALGFASFGPIDLHPDSPTYGYITTTPKPGWAFTDVVGTLRSALGVPVAWDTDTNGAALGEYRWGAGQDLQILVYLTVGTGIGGGALVDGRPIHGLLHPEMGHLLVERLEGDTFPGICPYHGRCLEGLASGPALRARLGRPAEEVSPDDPVWELEAYYLAAGIHEIGHVVSPQRIIVGGGVAQTSGLLKRVRSHVVQLNHGYLAHPAFQEGIDGYIVPPGLGTESGVLGALMLARLAAGGADS